MSGLSFLSSALATLGSGLVKAIRATGTGELAVEVGGSNTSAFGDINFAEHTPVLQYDFVYQGAAPAAFTAQLMTNTVASTGVIDTTQGRLRLTSGANAAGNAIHQSTKILRYRAGQGNMVRFTYVWTNNAANSIHIAGVGNSPLGSAATDGYFFGYDGTTFGILHRNQYGAPVDTWYAKTAWNVDKCDGTNSADNPSGFNLDPTKGNVFMIRYPYLGYGDIVFYVQNPSTGRWIICHVIQYANSRAIVQLSNPGMRFYAQAFNNNVNTTSLVGYIGSVGGFLSGQRIYTGPVYGENNRQAVNNAGTEKPVLSIRNATSMNGVPNMGVIRLRSISLSADGVNNDTIYRLRKVAYGALTNPSFSAVYGTLPAAGTPGNDASSSTLTAAQSIASIDKAATAITPPAAGTNDVIFNAAMARNTGYQVDLTPYDLFLNPGEIVSICGTTFTSNNCAWNVAVNWNEDV